MFNETFCGIFKHRVWAFFGKFSFDDKNYQKYYFFGQKTGLLEQCATLYIIKTKLMWQFHCQMEIFIRQSAIEKSFFNVNCHSFKCERFSSEMIIWRFEGSAGDTTKMTKIFFFKFYGDFISQYLKISKKSLIFIFDILQYLYPKRCTEIVV